MVLYFHTSVDDRVVTVDQAKTLHNLLHGIYLNLLSIRLCFAIRFVLSGLYCILLSSKLLVTAWRLPIFTETSMPNLHTISSLQGSESIAYICIYSNSI